MIVTTISATIRYSQDTGKGAWKVIELGAETSVSDHEFWKQAQSELYYQLGDQLRQLSHNGTGAALSGAGGTETAIEPLPASEPTQRERDAKAALVLHPQFGVEARTKNGVTWYSHRHGKGWCSEPEPAERR